MTLLGKCIDCKKQIDDRCKRCFNCHSIYKTGKCFITLEGKKRLSENMLKNNPHKGKQGKRIVNREGYISIYQPEHPFKSKQGYVFQHRLEVEKKIGRFLTKEEVVHHLNENKTDNRIENLMLFPNTGFHLSFHLKIKQYGITNPILKQIEERWKKCIVQK